MLIADDEAIEREAIQFFITQANLDFKLVAEAVNGIQAVSRAEELMPEIIIMDIKMPGKDGLEAAREIRQFNPFCKIIFLTAFNEFEFAHKAIKVKAEDFIIKPAYSETLIEALTGIIAGLDRENQLAITDKGNRQEENNDSDAVLSSSTALLIERVCSYIDQNYSKGIKLEEMCNMVGFSKYYFSRVFKQYKNMNLIDYITFRRIEKSKEMLKDPCLSIKEISSQVGYNDANYLTAVFKKWEGVSPTEYRNKQYR